MNYPPVQGFLIGTRDVETTRAIGAFVRVANLEYRLSNIKPRNEYEKIRIDLTKQRQRERDPATGRVPGCTYLEGKKRVLQVVTTVPELDCQFFRYKFEGITFIRPIEIEKSKSQKLFSITSFGLFSVRLEHQVNQFEIEDNNSPSRFDGPVSIGLDGRERYKCIHNKAICLIRIEPDGTVKYKVQTKGHERSESFQGIEKEIEAI